MLAARSAGEPNSTDWRSALHEDGYCLIPGVLPAAQIADLGDELLPLFGAADFSKGLFNGYRTKRCHGLLKRSRGTALLVMNPLILEIAESMLLPFCDTLQLNLTQASEIHPGALAQIPHRDEDMWAGEKGRAEYVVNVMWPFTPFTPENGGTMLWPGSHRRPDLKSPAEGEAFCPELGPGDALLFLGSTLHGAGANRTLAVRRGVLISYCLGWLKPYENMWLTYPPDTARHFPPALRDLVGYRRHRPNLGNYDGQCPSILFEETQADRLAATDALTPEQERVLAAHAARQVSVAGLGRA